MKLNELQKGKNMLYSKQAGITLIALVITIVVLLILAGVSINALFSDNGIIERAKEARNKIDKAIEKDLEEINKLNNWLEENGGISNSPTVKSYTEASKNEDGTLKENAKYTDSERAEVTIPKGFKVSDVAGTESTDGEQTVSKGLVIQDKDVNQFVWVPVNYTATGKDENSNGLDDGFEATFKRTNSTSSSNTEPYADGYSGEDTDYMNMMKSVQANKGFYIGRYEAGTTSPRTSSTTTTSQVVVKRDAYPYIYVGWGNAMNDITTDVTDQDGKVRGKGAVYLSKNMYTAGEIGATGTLCYGVQWDEVMKFVEDSTHSTTNSTTWGNYQNNAWTINRTTASYATNVATGSWTAITSNKSKTNSEQILLTTGASDNFKAKNIFDLAGNVWKWSMEADGSTYRVLRGGDYLNNGSVGPASIRGDSGPTSSVNGFGFRPALYL